MKSFSLGLVAATFLAGVAMAQPAPSAAPGNGSTTQLSPQNNGSTTPPAVTTSQQNNRTSAAPVAGRNSFSMGEARRRIEAGGFSQVTGLRKDNRGVWRGKGMKDGQSVTVYCDYQGNVGTP